MVGKVRGGFGETDFKNKVVKIDNKKHKSMLKYLKEYKLDTNKNTSQQGLKEKVG